MLAFAVWIPLRCEAPGHIFCNIKHVGGSVRIYQSEPVNQLFLVTTFRKLYAPCGVLDAGELATDSAKRSGVQFYEALHKTPVWIMDKGGWTDPASFMMYRSLCNRAEQRQAYEAKESWQRYVVASGCRLQFDIKWCSNDLLLLGYPARPCIEIY